MHTAVDPVSDSNSPAPSTMMIQSKSTETGNKAGLGVVNGHANDAFVNSASNSKPTTNGADSDADAAEDAESHSLDKMLQVSVIILRQAIDLVNQSLTDDAQLTYDSKFIPGSTIGKHLRHATDHFSLLLDSLSAASSSNSEPPSPHLEQKQQNDSELELNYDVRARGTPMESSRDASRTSLENCIARLEELVPTMDKDKMLKLTAVTPFVQTFKTSFGRELWFAALHAIHHWSLIRVVAGELGIQLEDSFGVAPSTLVYRRSEGPLGGKAKL